jgi:hypothetical protein
VFLVPTNQIIMLVAAGIFLLLYLARRRARLRKD